MGAIPCSNFRTVACSLGCAKESVLLWRRLSVALWMHYSELFPLWRSMYGVCHDKVESLSVCLFVTFDLAHECVQLVRQKFQVMSSECGLVAAVAFTRESDGSYEVRVFPSPGGLEYTAQMLCCAANGIVTLGSLPVFAHAGLGNPKLDHQTEEI